MVVFERLLLTVASTGRCNIYTLVLERLLLTRSRREQKFRHDKEKMKNPQSAFLCAALAFSITGCLPGGIFLPAPVPHNDRPAIRGILLENGRPLSRQNVEAVSFTDGPPQSCSNSDARAETSYLGEFEILGDRDLLTLWWGNGPNGFTICLPETGDGAVWSTHLKRSEFPPFIPEHVDVMCNLVRGAVLSCITSLDDAKMVDCTDDLDYDPLTGWLDAVERMPFSGRCVSFHDNGQLLERADFVQGIRVGLWTGYNEIGGRDDQSYWIDGRRRRETVWYPDGQMFRQTHYRATADERGRPVRHGLNTVWMEDGSIDSKICWIDGVEFDIPPDNCYFV
jgi:hypothetical protein